jgi:hypothetical protein
MKKLLALLMVLAVLIPSAAFAASDIEYEVYTNPTDGYQISFPSDWILLNSDTIDAVLDAVASNSVEGLDASSLEGQKEQIMSMDVAIAMAPDSWINVNVIYTPAGAHYSAEELKGEMGAMLDSFSSMFQDFEGMADGEIAEYNGIEYVIFSGRYSIAGGQNMLVQLYSCPNTTLYIITVTINVSHESFNDVLSNTICDAIMNSFVPGDA